MTFHKLALKIIGKKKEVLTEDILTDIIMDSFSNDKLYGLYKMGKKDILKVECDINMLDLDVLAFIDHNITVNVIKDGEIVDKKELVLPKEIKNVIKCKNPRCITSIEQELPHIFILTDEEKEKAIELINNNYPWVEVGAFDGGQSVYSYFIDIE